MRPTHAELFTIGHSNHPVDFFLDLVRRPGIETIADVRARPYSRFVPHFGKERLARTLSEEGIGYLYLGDRLGGTPSRQVAAGVPAPDYARRIRGPTFLDGVAKLLEAIGKDRVALMCRERDPLDCHRLHLICRYIKPRIGRIRHILPDGRLEAHEVTERRLLERAGTHELPLFETAGAADDQALERAYDRWWQAMKP